MHGARPADGHKKNIMAVERDETRTMERKMAAPRGGTNDLRRSVNCVVPAMETGEFGTRDAVMIIRETCRTGVTNLQRAAGHKTKVVRGGGPHPKKGR